MWGGWRLGVGRGHQTHPRFKLGSKGKQVSKVIKMLQSSTARTGKLCGNKTTSGGCFGCQVCKTFPCTSPQADQPSPTHSHTKGMQILGSVTAISPVLGKVPAPQCQAGWSGGHSSITRGCHTGHTHSPALS